MLGEVVEVFLKDGNPDDIYKIGVLVQRSIGSVSSEFAYPLNPYIKSIPTIGEQVYLISALSSKSGLGGNNVSFYYISPTFLQKSLNNNPLPKGIKNAVGSFGASSYLNPIPEVSSVGDNTKDFGKGFSEVNTLSQLQPYIGDIIFEGRFGQSIRFGYTPKQTDAQKLPSWNSTDSGAPITIIRNTQNDTNKKGYDKFVVEDVNKDDSCIWMTSKQRIPVRTSNKVSISNISQYSNPQIIINSNRLVFNSKSDSIVLSSYDNMYISTSNWKADINTMFSQIEELKNTLQSLTTAIQNMVIAYSALTVAPLTPIGAPAAAANIIISEQVIPALTRITTALTKMKQL
jgi:hypothetical protein